MPDYYGKHNNKVSTFNNYSHTNACNSSREHNNVNGAPNNRSQANACNNGDYVAKTVFNQRKQ